jgi:hypothetical protein
VQEPTYTLHVEREDGELLVIDGLDLARGFIAGDPSAQPGGYDALAGKGSLHRITIEDVITVNQMMRARSGHAHWQPVFDDDQAWLAGIPPDLDIIEADDEEWAAARGADLVSEAIAFCVRPHVALARATKVLHLKRPKVFPVLDELVVQVMGVNLPDAPTRERRIAIAQRVTAAIRREGRANIQTLREIQRALAHEGGANLSLVRIFDICLWFSHPTAGVPGVARQVRVGLRG